MEQERLWPSIDSRLVIVVCRKCGAGFIVHNVKPLNKRTAIPFAPDIDMKDFKPENPPRFGLFGMMEGTMTEELRTRLEEEAARSFVCANAHGAEHLVPAAHLSEKHLTELLAKRPPYNKEDRSVTLWTDDGELVRITGDVSVEFQGKEIRYFQTVTKETLWYIPPPNLW
jgi:hypothetical protein